jgi:Leucine-rich repeat (LRR) protein
VYKYAYVARAPIGKMMLTQVVGKRRFNPDAPPPQPGWKLLAEVQHDLLIKIIEFALPYWRTDCDQFRQLAKLRQIDDHSKELIERMYRVTKEIPCEIECVLTNEALQRFPNLEYLFLENHVMQDRYDLDLTHLSKLGELRVPKNHGHFILGPLVKLDDLSLEGVNERYIGLPLKIQLASLTQIRHLNIKDSDIIEDDQLVNFVNLKWLNMQENRLITNLSLQHLTKLETLYLENNNITNDAISKLTNLDRLEMINQPNITQSLVNLPHLRYFDCNGTDVNDTIIKQLTGLKELTVWDQDVTGEGLLTLTNLKKLSLEDNDHVKGEFVSQMTWLKKIDLRRNRLIDYQHIRPLTELKEIMTGSQSLVNEAGAEILLELFRSRRLVNALTIERGDNQ